MSLLRRMRLFAPETGDSHQTSPMILHHTPPYRRAQQKRSELCANNEPLDIVGQHEDSACLTLRVTSNCRKHLKAMRKAVLKECLKFSA